MDETNLNFRIKEMIVRRLELKHITPADIQDNVNLFSDAEIGLDSIDALEIAVGLEQEFEFPFKESDVPSLASINAITDLLLGRREE